MIKVNRRNFLRNAGLAGAGALALEGLIRRADLIGTIASGASSSNAGRFGPLIPTETLNTHEVMLALPKNFHYVAFGKTGDRMSDGILTPPAHDGMWAFNVKGQVRLVRNHEVNNQVGTPGSAIAPKAYDPLAGGGTSTVVINPKTRKVIKDFVSLSGTLVNCAGGPTPWNSWISCEETVLGPRRYKNAEGQDQGGFSKRHGYCFEVPAAADKPVDPVPLKAMGRFVHEALAVDPHTGIVYLTEDRATSGFYRFTPSKPGKLAAGGKLQMLAVRDQPHF
ncbi:MAG: alkaline phosphatase PhoX, partial [Pyrinomonadaceae bacterium]